MLKTTKERKICLEYGTLDRETGKVKCDQCPQRVDMPGGMMGCKAICHQTDTGEWVYD